MRQLVWSTLLRKREPGLTDILLHLGHDDAELRAVMIGNEPS